MLHMFFAVAFSAVPLTLYIPPVRSLNLFLETMEDLCRESRIYSRRMYPRVRRACSRIFNSVLRTSTSTSRSSNASFHQQLGMSAQSNSD
nr:hypothetical protein DM860_001202 [Ipomoea batatas]